MGKYGMYGQGTLSPQRENYYSFDNRSVFVCRDRISRPNNFATGSHRHEDLEFCAVLSGHMLHNVNGEIVRLEAGEGIFVNSNHTHYIFSPDDSDCEYCTILLHPMLLCSSSQLESFISSITSDQSRPYILLYEDIPWKKDILLHVRQMYDCHNDICASMKIQGHAMGILASLYENVFQYKYIDSRPRKSDRHSATLSRMTAFIESNYREKLTLEEIAKAGLVSKSNCLAMFKKYLNDTPVHYLIAYRLKIAAQLLKTTRMSVTELALETGFPSASYFSETFRKIYGVSPIEYKKQSSVQKNA